MLFTFGELNAYTLQIVLQGFIQIQLKKCFSHLSFVSTLVLLFVFTLCSWKKILFSDTE